MKNADLSSADVADFESGLKSYKVKLVLYKAPASDPAVQRLLQIARQEKIHVVGVSEAKPPNMTYQQGLSINSMRSTER
jgi:zinc/manganese transport system substrate-binding protein